MSSRVIHHQATKIHTNFNISTGSGELAETESNYCILSSLHIHDGFVVRPPEAAAVDGFSIGNKQERIYESLLMKSSDGRRHKIDPNLGINSTSHTTNTTNPLLLDPYIDSVQVKHRRVGNKRGARVEAAAATAPQSMGGHDHVPKSSSYYSTTKKKTHMHHLKESKSANKEWDDSSSDDDSDDSDDDYDEDGKHKHPVKKYRHGKKKHLGGFHYKKRKGKRRKSKRKAHHAKVYKPKTRIYVKQRTERPQKKYHDQHHYHDKDKHHHHDDHHYDTHKGKHFHGKHYDDRQYHYHHHDKSKGKLVHLDLMGKGKMSLAGVLGYTLLCVNYLLVLKEPSYDKYGGHYYTRYKPHGGHGDTVEIKTGGPIILAHCGELPEARDLVQHVPSLNKIELIMGSATNEKVDNSTATTASVENKQRPVAAEANFTASSSSSLNRNTKQLTPAEQRWYYNSIPTTNNNGGGFGAQQQHPNGGLLSPLQLALNRLFSAPAFGGGGGGGATMTTNNDDFEGGDDDGEYGGVIQVMPRPRQQQQQHLVPTNNRQLIGTNNVGLPINVGGGGQTTGAIISNRGRLVALVDQQPQVVQTRDNLVDMRTRQIQIGLRIADGRRFGLAQLALTLARPATPNNSNNNNNGDQQSSRINGNSAGDDGGDSVQDDDDGNQTNVQQQANNASSSSSARQVSGSNFEAEYALSGDSIELTCNHRVPTNRLVSVRWFRDTFEFYRFVPARRQRQGGRGGDLGAAKTAFPMLDISLDLARSGSQSVYLRNLTHSASGQYRCEVVSDSSPAADLQLVSGQRALKVYSLPDSGPQLMILAADDDLPPTARRQMQLVAVRNGGARQPVFLGEREGDWPIQDGGDGGRDGDEDGNNNNFADSPGLNNAPQQQQQQRRRQQQQQSTQIVRCLSARSNPAAQLRFFINNRPVELARTLENSTLSYSDGLEANVVSFRLELGDFLAQASAALDRAATLKSKQPDNDGGGATSTTSSTTTTTTTTTARPRERPTVRMKSGNDGEKSVRKSSSKKKKKEKVVEKERPNPNASIQFDDHHEDQLNITKTTTKLAKPKKEGLKKNQGQKKKNSATNSRNGGTRNNNSRNSISLDEDDDSGGASELREDKSATTIDDDASQVIAAVRHDYPSLKKSDLFEKDSNKAINGTIKERRDLFRLANLIEQLSGSTGVDEFKLAESGGRRTTSPSSERLVKQEQVGNARTISSTGSGLRSRDRNNQREQALVYSNFIRIRCSSLVPTLNYEMISELNVPLTLLVPSSQLNEIQQQQQQQQLNANNQQDLSRRNEQVDDETEGSAAEGNRTGGSLQAPRSVSIERIAQASHGAHRTTREAAMKSSSLINRQQQTLNRTSSSLPVAATTRTSTNAASRRTIIFHSDLGAFCLALIVSMVMSYKNTHN